MECVMNGDCCSPCSGTANRKVLAIDPGTTHLVAAIFTITGKKINILWNHMFRVDHDPARMAVACRLMVYTLAF